MNLQEFQNFLISFQQNNNEVIQQSTEFYQSCLSAHPSEIIMLHFQNILAFSSPNLVAMSIILLKRAFVSNGPNFIESIDPNIINQITNIIPNLFLNENMDTYLFSLLVDTTSRIAIDFFQKRLMLDFIPKLVSIVKMMSPTLSPPALNCITQCNNYKSMLQFHFNSEEFQTFISIENVYQIISVALSIDFSVDFTISALRFLFSFYVDNFTPQLKEFALPVSEVYSKIPEQNLVIALSDLYIFCKIPENSFFFSETLPVLMSSLLSIVNGASGGLSSTIQSIAISIFICLAENYDVQFQPFLNDVTSSILRASCNYIEDESIEDIDSNAPYSDEAIYFLSERFSSKTEYPKMVIKISAEIVQSEEWNLRRAGIAAIYQMLLSCETGLDVYLEDIFSLIRNHFGDPHYLCRYYSFKAISELFNSYSLFVSQFVPTLIPLIISIWKAEVSYPTKVAELSALESICGQATLDKILPIAQQVIEEILPQIQNPESSPMEQLMIIKLISKIALTAKINFEPFYLASITWLKTAIGQTNPGEENTVRIQTIETIPSIGRVVDISIFLNDGVEFMQYLLQNDFSILGDNEKYGILYAIQEMSGIIPGEVYSQFLPGIFQYLGATLSSEVSVEEFPLSFDVSTLTDKIFIPLRESNIIKTYSRPQLSFYNQCIELLNKLIENLKAILIPFVNQIYPTVIKYVGFLYYSPLQSASINFFNSLINLYKEFDPQLLNELLPFIRNAILPIVSQVFANPVHVLSECFDLLSNSMDGATFEGSYTSLLTVILIQLDLKRSLVMCGGKNLNSPELFSLDDLEISIEKFARVLLHQFTQDMIAYSPHFLHSRCCIFHLLYMTDVFEIMINDPNNLINFDQLISLIFESVSSPRMNLSYAAFICLSKIIQIVPLNQSLIEQSTNKIAGIINQYEDDEADSPNKVIDSALIALSAIFKVTFGRVDLSQFIQMWFKQMPVYIDDNEASIAFEALCIFVNSKNPFVLNPGSLNHLLKCFSVAIRDKKISNEIRNQIIFLTKSLCSNEEMHELVQSAILSLKIDERKYIQNAL